MILRLDDLLIRRVFRPPALWIESRTGLSPIRAGGWLLGLTVLSAVVDVLVDLQHWHLGFSTVLNVVFTLVAVRWLGTVSEIDRRRAAGHTVPVRVWPFSPQLRAIMLVMAVTSFALEAWLPLGEPGLSRLVDNVANGAFPLGLYFIASGDLPPRKRQERPGRRSKGSALEPAGA